MLDVRPHSKANPFRRQRIALLKELIAGALAEKQACRILDLGGTYDFWTAWGDEVDWSTTKVICVNSDPQHAGSKEKSPAEMIAGDACHLVGIEDNEFDVAFSNSVIEHVGCWKRMRAMADEVKRVAPRYLVQTPNFWFPIEPHARTAFLHWMPEPIAYRVVMRRKCGYWSKQNTIESAVETVQSAHLIDFNQMQALFPDAKIIRERFMGLTKSLIAVKE